MHARYADGQAAIFRDVSCEFGADALTVNIDGASHVWAYADLMRADDDNGRITLRFIRDTGERLMLTNDALDVLRGAAPRLASNRARGVEGPGVIVGLMAGAWATAAAFLVGVPMLAGPIADVMPSRVRHQIADISWSQVQGWTEICDDAEPAEQVLNDVAYRMMERSDVAMRDDIWITIVHTDIPNAFALPDQTIVITDALIEMAEGPDEIVGVIGHEIAHIEHNHILKGLVRSVGAGIFFDVVFGGAGAGQAIAIASVNLSGLRFSRDDEADADARGLEYLEAANINSLGLAQLFERIEALMHERGGSIPLLLSSHPASDQRAANARAHARPGLPPSMSDTDWQTVRAACAAYRIDEEEDPETPAEAVPAAPQAPTPEEPAAAGATGED